MIHFLKKIVRPSLKSFGIYNYTYREAFKIQSFWYKHTNILKKKFLKTAVILTYHRIDTVSSDPHLLCVTPEYFERHLQFLKENYEVISLIDLQLRLNKNILSGNEAVITLDDGYKDNIKNALPLLEKYNLPATIFITTGFLGQKANFAWDKEYKKEDTACFLSEEEIAVLGKHPLITIGAHTHTHPRLSNQTKEEQINEIKISQSKLQEIINKPIEVFAYPFGGIFDFTEETIKAVSESGFTICCSTKPKLVTNRSNRYTLPRINIRNYSTEILSQKLFHYVT